MKIRLYISILIMAVIGSCEPVNTPPTAVVSTNPQTGDTTTVFLLDGQNSSDKETSYFVLRYRWDINADGTWDTEYSTRNSYTARFSKPGYQKFIMEVADEDGGIASVADSVFILSSHPVMDTLTDPRDAQKYPIVKIGGNWWMAANLRYGTPVDYMTPMLDNDQVEYLYFNNKEEFTGYGGLYTWLEANHYPSPALFRDICPPGWRIPTRGQWQDLFKNYPQPFDMMYYFGPSSQENLGIEMHGFYRYGDPYHPMRGAFLKNYYSVRYWTSDFTGEDTTRFFTGINITRDSAYFVTSFNRTEWLYNQNRVIIGVLTPEAAYVRCVK